MEKMNCKAVIFDFDGTLVDSEPVHLKALILTAKHFNIMPDEDFHFAIGHNEVYLMHYLRRNYPNVPDGFLEKSYEIFFSIFNSSTDGGKTFDTVMDTIKKLSELNIKMAIGTNSILEYVEMACKNLGIDKYIKHYSTFDLVGKAKPSPDIFLNALKLLDVDASEAIVIEDSIPGVEAGKNANIKTIAVTNTYEKDKLMHADIVINKMIEIFDYIKV